MPSHSHPHIHAKKLKAPIDRVMDVVAVASPFLGVPQAIQIFATGDAAGLSLFSWLAFATTGAIFLLYGIKHQIVPVIVSQSLWMFIYAAVIPGILIYG